MPDALTLPPPRVIAGDTLAFTYRHDGYSPAAGWALSWALAGDSIGDVAGVPTAAGDAWTVRAAPAITAVWAAGAYTWAVRVTKDGDAFTVAVGTLVVQPDPASAAAGELTSWAQRTLVVVEAALRGTLTDAQRSYMIGDTQVVRMAPSELMRVRAQLRRELRAERNGGRVPGVRVVFTS